MQAYSLLSHRDLSSALKTAPCFSPGCPLRNPLVMVTEKRGILGRPKSQWLNPSKGFFLNHVTCQHRSAGILIHRITQRPRLTKGCTGALHSLNSEVMSLSPLVTSSQNALAMNVMWPCLTPRGPGSMVFSVSRKERELESSEQFFAIGE